jgi:hypothetical protein
VKRGYIFAAVVVFLVVLLLWKIPTYVTQNKTQEMNVLEKTEDRSENITLNIINPSENLFSLTAEQILNLILSNQREGNPKNIIGLKDLIGHTPITPILAMGEEGAYEKIKGTGYFIVEENFINYFEPESNSTIHKIRGILIDAPEGSIMDTYHHTLNFLEKDNQVLIIFIDGFGFHQYIFAIKSGWIPYLKSLNKAEMVSSVYQSVTNAGFAAMITGKPPFINGVYSRDQRDLEVPSIFGTAQELNKKAILIQGSINVLNTEIEPVLNIDLNNNGVADDEVFERAMEELNKDYDLMLVHFKAVDIYGHKYGDLHEKTMEILQITDGYIKEIVEKWMGKVIIVSDHGMHSSLEGGLHGDFRFEDMIVPYLIIEGKGNDEKNSNNSYSSIN